MFVLAPHVHACELRVRACLEERLQHPDYLVAKARWV
jgi:hypothetical protein